MIDHTSTRIEQQETALRRQNRRRYAFQRMLEATDRVLWQLEEMNRDGVKNVPPVLRAELKVAVPLMARHAREPPHTRAPAHGKLGSPLHGPGRPSQAPDPRPQHKQPR